MATPETIGGAAATAPAAAPGNQAPAPGAAPGAPGAAPGGAAPGAPGAAPGGRGGRGGGGGGPGGGGRVDYRPNPRVDRKFDKEAVDKAFEALKTFDWSMDYNNVLLPIDDAVVSSHGNAEQRKDLETRVDLLLKTNISRATKDYCCRVLRIIGTNASVPALASLLLDKDCSHMARYALERIATPEAIKEIRDALPKADNALKPGIIEGLAASRDAASVGTLIGLTTNADQAIAVAAIIALGRIGTPEAGKALGELVKTAPDATKLYAADAALMCAERLTADGKRSEALELYKGLTGESQPKHVRLAATRGMLGPTSKP